MVSNESSHVFKITIKPGLIVFHKERDWNQIKAQLVRDFGPGILISWKLKRELGFTVRYHQAWLETKPEYAINQVRFYPEEQVHLDFFTESAQSWFILRYCNKSITVDQ